jgi:uncharacterized protein (DUF433 family)
VSAGTIAEHVEVVEGAGGRKARIAGHRVRVQDVAVWHEKLGLTADEIVERHPELTLADVHAALAYYWDHRDAIEQAIAEDGLLAAELRRTNASPLAERRRRGRTRHPEPFASLRGELREGSAPPAWQMATGCLGPPDPSLRSG